MEAALGQEWRFFLHGNQFSNYENYAILKGMDRTTLTDFLEEVETTEEYNGYFCSIAEAISIVVLGSLCGFQNVSQIHQWAESGLPRQGGVSGADLLYAYVSWGGRRAGGIGEVVRLF